MNEWSKRYPLKEQNEHKEETDRRGEKEINEKKWEEESCKNNKKSKNKTLLGLLLFYFLWYLEYTHSFAGANQRRKVKYSIMEFYTEHCSEKTKQNKIKR